MMITGKRQPNNGKIVILSAEIKSLGQKGRNK